MSRRVGRPTNALQEAAQLRCHLRHRFPGQANLATCPGATKAAANQQPWILDLNVKPSQNYTTSVRVQIKENGARLAAGHSAPTSPGRRFSHLREARRHAPFA